MPEAVRRVFDDLLNIEVNTMVKSGMTGRKMPAFGHALLDIHGSYERWLNTYCTHLNGQWSGFRPSGDAEKFVAETIAAGEHDRWWVIEAGALIDHVTITAPFQGEANGVDLFETMRRRARIAEEMHRLLEGRSGFDVRDGGDIMLKRIIRNCDQLKAILQRAATGDAAVLTRATASGVEAADTDDLPRDDLITVRKAWEMGTEVIALQTVVQVDGDIVTRLNSAYAAERHQPVRDLHRESVGSALEHWHFLVDTVVSIAKSAAGIFT
jgi:hypothetical protein